MVLRLRLLTVTVLTLGLLSACRFNSIELPVPEGATSHQTTTPGLALAPARTPTPLMSQTATQTPYPSSTPESTPSATTSPTATEPPSLPSSCNDRDAIQAVISNYLTSQGYSTVEAALASSVNTNHEVGSSPTGTRTFGYGRRMPTGFAPLYPYDFTAVNTLPFGIFEIAYEAGEQRYSSLCLVFGYDKLGIASGLIDVLVTRGQNSGNWYRVKPVINSDSLSRDGFYYDRQQLLDELISAIDNETMASIKIEFTFWDGEEFVATPVYGTPVPPHTLLTDALFETNSLAVRARWNGGWPEGIEPGYVDPQVLQEKLRENPTDLGLVITTIMFDGRNPTPAPKFTLEPLTQYDTFESREATQQYDTIEPEFVSQSMV